MDQFQDANLSSTHMKRRLLYILVIEILNGFESLVMCYALNICWCYLQILNEIYTYAYFKRLDYFSTECMFIIPLFMNNFFNDSLNFLC